VSFEVTFERVKRINLKKIKKASDGSKFVELQRRKHDFQSRFSSWEDARGTGYRNEVNDWIGGKI